MHEPPGFSCTCREPCAVIHVCTPSDFHRSMEAYGNPGHRAMSSHVSLPRDGSEAVFGREEFEARVRRAREALNDLGVELLTITSPENIFYLTGQQTLGCYMFQALMLHAKCDLELDVRQLELLNCIKNTYLESFEVYKDGDAPADVLASAFLQRPPRGRVSIKKKESFLSAVLYEQAEGLLGLVDDGSGIIEALRMVKSHAELEANDKAGRCVEAGMRAGLVIVAEDASVNDLVAAMRSASITAGSGYLGMDPMVSSGPHSGTAHASWRRRRLEGGDAISIGDGRMP